MTRTHPCPRCGRETPTYAKREDKGRQRLCDECRSKAVSNARAFREREPSMKEIEKYLDQVIEDEVAPPWAKKAVAPWIKKK